MVVEASRTYFALPDERHNKLRFAVRALKGLAFSGVFLLLGFGMSINFGE